MLYQYGWRVFRTARASPLGQTSAGSDSGVQYMPFCRAKGKLCDPNFG
jgi:hypothetical protein